MIEGMAIEGMTEGIDSEGQQISQKAKNAEGTNEQNHKTSYLLAEYLKYYFAVFEADYLTSFYPSYDGAVIHPPALPQVETHKAIQQAIQKPTPMPHVRDEIANMDSVTQSQPKPKNNIIIDLSEVKNIESLMQEVEKFEGCHLKTQTTKTVFCDGALQSNILLIGEAPGEEEDTSGVPFCGRSGKLLMEAFKAINLHRESDFLISNTVFYRPPLNRAPSDDEIEACRPFITRLVELSNITHIICIGGVSLKAVTGFDSISKARKQSFTVQIGSKNIKTTAVYHPSYLLRSPFKKKDMFCDLLWLKNEFLM